MYEVVGNVIIHFIVLKIVKLNICHIIYHIVLR